MATFTITLTIPDGAVDAVIAAYARHHGYDPEMGKTPQRFSREKIAEHVALPYQKEQQALAAAKARKEAEAVIAQAVVTA